MKIPSNLGSLYTMSNLSAFFRRASMYGAVVMVAGCVLLVIFALASEVTSFIVYVYNKQANTWQYVVSFPYCRRFFLSAVDVCHKTVLAGFRIKCANNHIEKCLWMLLLSRVVLKLSQKENTAMGSDSLNTAVSTYTSIFLDHFAISPDMWLLYFSDRFCSR